MWYSVALYPTALYHTLHCNYELEGNCLTSEQLIRIEQNRKETSKKRISAIAVKV